nr:MAG TPA: hypothetical protein [Caudoviricetes sp.]
MRLFLISSVCIFLIGYIVNYIVWSPCSKSIVLSLGEFFHLDISPKVFCDDWHGILMDRLKL